MSENEIGMGLGMLAIAVTWVVALATFAGLGYAFLRSARLERDGAEGLFAAVWIGWALALGVLQTWHLFQPVDVRVRVLVLALGGAGFLWNLPYLLARLRLAPRRVLPFAAASLLLTFWMANRAMAPAMEYDAGLYHLNTIRWLESYAIVPGLGNLHTRLASNSSYFLYMAAIDLSPWAHRAQHVAIYLLLLALGVQLGWTAFSVLLQTRPLSGSVLFRLVLIPAIVGKVFGGIHEGEPDLAVWVLGVVIIDALIRAVLETRRGTHALTSMLLVLTASSAAITVKLSAGAMGIAASAIAIVWAILRVGELPSVRHHSVTYLKMATLPLLLVCVWMLRGFVLSGYPAFPSALGGIDVDWRVPSEVAHNEVRWIRSWAMQQGGDPDVVLRGWDWVRPWSEGAAAGGSFDLVTPLAIAAAGFLVAVVRRRRWVKLELGLVAGTVAPAASLAVWFLTAPELRFAGAAAWLLAAGSLVLAAERSGVLRLSGVAPAVVLISLVAAVASHLTAEKYIRPGPERGFYGLPQAGVVEVTLPSGLTFDRPAQGDQCWDGPLLCAPYPPADLRLRVPDDLAHGFSVAP